MISRDDGTIDQHKYRLWVLEKVRQKDVVDYLTSRIEISTKWEVFERLYGKRDSATLSSAQRNQWLQHNKEYARNIASKQILTNADSTLVSLSGMVETPRLQAK